MQKSSHPQISEQSQENINTQKENLKIQYAQFHKDAKTQAQIDFLEREDQNVFVCSLDFNSWYHYTDVKRILWTLFQEVEEHTKKNLLSLMYFMIAYNQTNFLIL